LNYNWEEDLNYSPGTNNTGSGGEFVATGIGGQARGFLSIDNITVSGLHAGLTSQGCLADIRSAGIPTLVLDNNSQSNQPTHISGSFAPVGGLAKAASDCGVQAFDWVQTMNVPSPGGFFECADFACQPVNGLPGLNVTGQITDIPFDGWDYCNHSSPTFRSHSDCSRTYPFYQSADAAIHRPTLTCIVTLSDGRCVTLYTGDHSLNFFDAPADSCIANPNGSQGAEFRFNALVRTFCQNTTTTVPLEFNTTLVGILPNGDPSVLPFSFAWQDTFNGTTTKPPNGAGGISFNDLGVDASTGEGGITITAINGVRTESNASIPEPTSITILVSGLFGLIGTRSSRGTLLPKHRHRAAGIRPTPRSRTGPGVCVRTVASALARLRELGRRFTRRSDHSRRAAAAPLGRHQHALHRARRHANEQLLGRSGVVTTTAGQRADEKRQIGSTLITGRSVTSS
jgi:hypothetical protein